jgi:hypothetical protein
VSALLRTLLLVAASSLASGQESIYLTDAGCRTETLFADLEGARVHVSCSTNGAERVMRVSVTNTATAEVGRLREISIGFCGDSILGASAQSAWVTDIDRGGDGSVTWSLPDDQVDRLGIPSRARVGEFVVRLKPGWRKSQWFALRWGQGGVTAGIVTHDCQRGAA